MSAAHLDTTHLVIRRSYLRICVISIPQFGVSYKKTSTWHTTHFKWALSIPEHAHIILSRVPLNYVHFCVIWAPLNFNPCSRFLGLDINREVKMRRRPTLHQNVLRFFSDFSRIRCPFGPLNAASLDRPNGQKRPTCISAPLSCPSALTLQNSRIYQLLCSKMYNFFHYLGHILAIYTSAEGFMGNCILEDWK